MLEELEKIKEYLECHILKSRKATMENKNNVGLKNYFTGKETALIQLQQYIKEIENEYSSKNNIK